MSDEQDRQDREDYLEEVERIILEEIAYHQQAHRRAIEPLLKRLSDIRMLRPQRYLIPLVQAQAMGLLDRQEPPE